MSLLESPGVVNGHQAATDWSLVAPWYRWARRDGDPDSERAKNAHRPALHMYGSTDFVERFLADPQHSMEFVREIDEYQDLTWEPIPTYTSPFDGTTKKKRLSGWTKSPSGTRKLFLAAHSRFYTVAVGLHCDRPGFPMVDPDKVGEVGFVIRRVRTNATTAQQQAGTKLLQDLALARAQSRFQTKFALAKHRSRVLHPFRSPARTRVASGAAAAFEAYAKVEAAQRKLSAWASINRIEATTEAWVPGDTASFGAWLPVEDEPDEVIERVYPMRMLAPSPTDPDHAAHDGPIWWAPVPTFSDEMTADGSSRFSDDYTYEIRVFARAAGPCPGPIVWSAPSERFRLASFHDPDGCAQRPIEIRMPDLKALQATTAKPSVKLNTPPNSSIANVENLNDVEGGLAAQGDNEICFIFIPLITIVAMFLLNIFLPIIVFVFQLWWMLALKFCIPPSIDFEGGLMAELELTPPEIDFDVDFDLHIENEVPANAIAIQDLLKALFQQDGKGWQTSSPPMGTTPSDFAFGDELDAEYSADALIRLAIAHGLTDPDATPVYEKERTFTTAVTRDEVVHP